MLAHIAGAPVEETALSLAPVAFAAAGLASIRLRDLATGRRAGLLAQRQRRWRAEKRP
jgi:predicted alpha/beta-hydrolase family hydrolase